MKNLLFFNLLLAILLLSFSLPALSEEKSLVPENTNTKSEFNPKPASASLYNLGLKSYEQGDLKSAISFFKRAIDLDPEFVDAYYNLGAIYKKQKDFPLAIDSFQKAYNINHEDYEVAFELGSCYFEEKDYQTAKKYFSVIPTNFPKYNEAKQKMDLSTQYLAAINNQGSASGGTAVIPKESQAQLLTDTLTKAVGGGLETQPENPNPATAEQPSQPQTPEAAVAPVLNDQAQLLVNNLAKPSKEDLTTPIKTITANFNGPTGIAKDSKNNLYIENFANDRIERITSDGKREVFFEKNGIKGPVGLAIDKDDNLYVANYSSDSIIKITQNKEVSFISNKVIRPYYLLYDLLSNKLFATIQGNDSLVEINTSPDSKQPITAR